MKRAFINRVGFAALLVAAVLLTLAFAYLSAPFFNVKTSAGYDGTCAVTRSTIPVPATAGVYTVARSSICPQTRSAKFNDHGKKQNILRERRGSTFTSGFV